MTRKRKPSLGIGAAYDIRNNAGKRAWMRDHPGKEYPEHLFGLSDEEADAFIRWMNSPKEVARRNRLEQRLKKNFRMRNY